MLDKILNRDEEHNKAEGGRLKKISKTLVTGGAGFIGSHIVDELIARGIETYVIDNLSTGSLENLKQHKNSRNNLIHLLIGDIKDLCKSHREELNDVDVVFHEAAIASVSESIENPLLVHDNNVTTTLELMNFCLRTNVRRFVFASSAAVYGAAIGKNRRVPYLSEDIICRPFSPYGASKLAVENYIDAYRLTYGLGTVILRYFNVFGTRQNSSNVVTVFINKLLNKEHPFIFGDGTQVRDFVHVNDIVQANLLAINSNRGVGEVFNIGSGRATAVDELFTTLRSIIGVEDIECHFEPSRVGDINFSLASIEKARRYLGYDAKISLCDGLEEIVDAFRETSGKKVQICSIVSNRNWRKKSRVPSKLPLS